MPLHAWAVACDVIFSNGIQATAANGSINLSYHSLLTGGSATLKTKTLTDNTSWVACSGSSCAASGTAATTSSVTFSTGTGTNGAISVAANSTLSKASGDYSTTSVGQQATLTFSTANGTYKTTAFTTGYQSIVQLQSGDYWINGNLTLGQETVLKRIASSGTTRIFVNGNITMAYKVSTQSYVSDQLLIYATGSITADNEANLTGFVYAAGNVSFNFKSVINGGVSGANFTASGNEVTVNYQSSAFTTANFAPFCSGATVAPVLLGSWRMDEGSWNGTAGEVIDSSGKGNHGRARIAAGSTPLPSTTSGSAPAYSVGAQSTCRYGAFDGTGSPSRTYSYVELSGFPALPNGFTFAAWIRSTNAGAQHQRILVRDDADNGWGLSLADGTGQPELRFFNRNVTNNGAVTGQGTNPNCGVFCVDTNPIIASNTWYYVAAAVDTSAQTVTLYVYSQAGVLQAKAVGAYSGTWKDGTGTAAIGGETSASSEGQQSSWHFLGNIDEVNIYSGALSQSGIEALLPSVRTCPAPDHYELQVAASNVACAGADVTVRACADSAVPCNQDNSVNTGVTLATSAGALNTTALALVNGTATTKLLYGAAAEGATATITLSNEVTAATNARKCCTGTSSCSVANSCTTTFKKAGFIFPGTLSGTSDTIPTQRAGVASNTVASPVSNYAYIRAVQTSSATNNACVARFTSPQTVPMAYQCVNPSTCVAGQTLSMNGTGNIPGYAQAAAVSSYTNVSFNFDANGNAPISMSYSDVGQIHLIPNLVLPATTNDPAYTMTGQSNDFVVRPFAMKIPASPVGVTTVAGVANPGKTSEAGSANNFVSAGTPFKVSVQATNAGGNVTPNFGNETQSQSRFITLVTNSLVYPDPVGGSATALTYTANSFSLSPSSPYTYSNPTVVWPQVGSMTIMPGLSDYLATNTTLGAIGGTASSTVGRFYPDHYRVVPASSTATNGCGAFSYMGQKNLLIKPYIVAESAGTGQIVVSNYDNRTLGYGVIANAKLSIPVYAAEDNANGVDLSSRMSADTGTWVNGVYNDTVAGTFARHASTAPDGPFNNLRVGVSGVTDTTPSAPYDIVGGLINSPASTPAPKDMLSASAIAFKDPAAPSNYLLNLRYGRLRLDDAFGPETYPLDVNFVTEYWAGNRFIVNANDSCTQVPRAAVSYKWGTNYASGGPLTNATNLTVPLSSGSTQGTYFNMDPATNGNINFNAGNAGQKFTKPSAGGTGTFIVSVDTTLLSWLSFDWDQGKTAGPDTKLPNATFSFGSYRGNDRIIYWREKLQ
ncbi:hypothetical protein GCM10011613_10210 [Cellvibrio zantedeschiae]|uniref:LamG-like jellyroll fold domain-containing protein n=2 Tax=Cellvibrio zantedeschiae TaxID=1237077 RepID=A0ABQ3AW20_9GAMM|nr:hypothetical protein GCM10011613_10210 [Cellvibrio zantedeschiae]